MNSIRMDPYLIDVMMRDLVGHDRQPSAFLVYLCLWARTFGRHKHSVRMSLRELAEATGLSKSAVQAAVRRLVRRRLIRVRHDSPTAVPEYFPERPWAPRRRFS